MMTLEEALGLFDAMCSAHALRDAYRENLSAHWHGVITMPSAAVEAFRRAEAQRNAEGNAAAYELHECGYFAYRDEGSHYSPTLRHEGRDVATWHGFGNVVRL